MAYIIAIFMLLSSGNPQAQTVQGNLQFREDYIQRGILPGQSKPPTVVRKFNSTLSSGMKTNPLVMDR